MTQTIQVPAGSLLILSGLPASGKSTLKRTAQGFRDLEQAWISTDEIRCQVFPSYREVDELGILTDISQAANGEVYGIVHARLRARLAQGQTCIVDATSLNDAERKSYVEVAKEYGAAYKVLILASLPQGVAQPEDTTEEEILQATLQTSLERNAKREVRVPGYRIEEMCFPPVAAQCSPKVESKAPTPPTGFTVHSKYPFEVVYGEVKLVHQLPELEQEAYDVLGDTHGLLSDTLELLKKNGWTYENGCLRHPERRKLLVLGDFVDRGPDSMGLIRLFKKAVQDGVARALRGNHEAKLVKFIHQVGSLGTKKWGSLSNSETGMELLAQPDCNELVEFMKCLPAFQVLRTADGHQLGFVHATMRRFDAELSLSGDCIYGQFGYERGVDTDVQYEDLYQKGLNKWVLFRGHIPQTSVQEHIFSLEREPYQKGELVLLRLDDWLSHVRKGESRIDAFAKSVLTVKSDFDYAASCVKWDLLKGLEALVSKKFATVQISADNLFKVYKYSKQTFWNNSWGESEWLVKARGIVLDQAGRIVSHPFDKVFNLHENGAGDDIEDSRPIIKVGKLNGFLGIVSAHPFKKGELIAHTQGSFDGPYVGYFTEYLLKPPVRGAVTRFLCKHNVTLMFEVIHPEDPHIIEYPPEMMGLHLIGIRGKSQEDKIWTQERVDEAALEMGLRRPMWERTTFGEMKRELKVTQTEGFMVHADNEQQDLLLKAKSPFYLVNKFLGRMGKSKISHMYSDPKSFKKTVDEEFYPLVDVLTASITKEDFAAMSNEERVQLVRGLCLQIL